MPRRMMKTLGILVISIVAAQPQCTQHNSGRASSSCLGGDSHGALCVCGFQQEVQSRSLFNFHVQCQKKTHFVETGTYVPWYTAGAAHTKYHMNGCVQTFSTCDSRRTSSSPHPEGDPCNAYVRDTWYI